ncbi:MAG: OsmC family protein [Pseudobdellovibrionaceae bacterium]
MKTLVTWNDGMQFEAATGGNSLLMDAKPPLGKNKGMTPKELVAAGLGGCTAMDVVALLKKHKQTYEKFEVEVDIQMSTGKTPAVFEQAVITFNLKGDVDKNIYLDSVRLSQTKYCGVSEMLLKAFPIRYIVILNQEQIGEGKTDFSGN